MNKSIIFGDVLANISGVSLYNHVTFITINHMKIETKELIRRTFIEFIKNFFSHLAIQNAIPFIGLKKGAISIAPIITATEFCSNQSDAIIQDKNISIRYNLSGLSCILTFFATSHFSSCFNSRISILLKKLCILSQNVSDFLLIFSSMSIFFSILTVLL